MGHPVVSTVTLATAVATGYAQSQSLGGAGKLTLNGSLVTGGVGTPDTARRVVVHSNGNDSARTITVVGTSRAEMGSISQSESFLAGNAADAVSTQDFATVTSISFDGASAGTVTAGTNGQASGPWVPWDTTALLRFLVRANGLVTVGAGTWQVDVTDDDVFGLWLPSGVPYPRAISWTPSIGTTAAWQGLVDQPIRASRLSITAISSAPLTVQLTQTQQGN